MRRRLLCIVVCAAFVSPMLLAQEQVPDTARTTSGSPSLPALRDSSVSLSPPEQHAKSPTLAMIFSAILPGAGQAYNESWWKVPLVTGLGIYFVSSWLQNDRLVTEYRDRYNQSLRDTPYGDARLLAQRDFYKTQRDSFTWYFLILYVLNIVDAYVDASLYNFDVNETLSLRLLPHGGRWEVRLQF